MPHTVAIRVRFADLDPYNHVNHARYLSYFEAARIEMLDQMGFGMAAMQRDGVQIVLVELTAGFQSPATLHDDLTVTTEVIEVKRATSRWRQKATNGDFLVATLEVKAAFTDLEGRPRRAPDGFTEAAQRFV